MRRLSLLVLLVGAALSPAADLTKVDPIIKKEPAYKGKPKYCLLVFGPEAKTRVWLVLDGATLYADLNGNGDLTEPGERFAGKQTEPGVKNPDYPFASFVEFSLPDIEGRTAYRRISVMHTLLKDEFGPKWHGNDELKARLAKHPGMTRAGVTAYIRGKVRQQPVTDFADRPQDAPVLHFDGPLTFAPIFAPTLERGDKPSEIQVGLGTKGLGWEAFALLDYDEVPEKAKPVALVEFPPKEPGGKPPRLNLALDRC
jgi:hypothetical protein